MHSPSFIKGFNDTMLKLAQAMEPGHRSGRVGSPFTNGNPSAAYAELGNAALAAAGNGYNVAKGRAVNVLTRGQAQAQPQFQVGNGEA